jgi:2-polyprenyl-3-methyl-5-hydroxy-6-metoxy-1,4-benzoquinol methylase
MEEMSEKFQQSIADSLEVDLQLLPYLPFLLQDLWALGSSVDLIIQVLKPLQLSKKEFRALDLGCGKGAVSIRLAEEYGIQVLGIDAMVSFLEVARKKARQHQVDHLCEFQEHDIHKFVKADHVFNLVILASLGGILGDLRQTVAKLRQQVRGNGYIIIDDGYLRKVNRLERNGYQHYRNREQTITELTSNKDLILQEVSTEESSRQINRHYFKVIEKRGKQLATAHPELGSLIKNYVDLQAEENKVIEEYVQGALWLLQKRD